MSLLLKEGIKLGQVGEALHKLHMLGSEAVAATSMHVGGAHTLATGCISRSAHRPIRHYVATTVRSIPATLARLLHMRMANADGDDPSNDRTIKSYGSVNETATLGRETLAPHPPP